MLSWVIFILTIQMPRESYLDSHLPFKVALATSRYVSLWIALTMRSELYMRSERRKSSSIWAFLALHFEFLNLVDDIAEKVFSTWEVEEKIDLRNENIWFSQHAVFSENLLLSRPFMNREREWEADTGKNMISHSSGNYSRTESLSFMLRISQLEIYTFFVWRDENVC